MIIPLMWLFFSIYGIITIATDQECPSLLRTIFAIIMSFIGGYWANECIQLLIKEIK